MDDDERFGLTHERLGSLPVVNWFFSRMGLDDVLEQHLPRDDARLRLAPAAVIGLVVRNIISSHRPLYALGEWAAPYKASLLGLEDGDLGALNDDRVGRMLDRLFDCDRASFITEVVLRVIREFDIDCSRFHNDSTTVTFHGAYDTASGATRAGKSTPAIVHGFNKDHRPDLKQLLYILTVSSDGAVPIAYRTADGNTVDDVTHIETWDSLVALIGSANFIYVADSKLCSAEAMRHIARGGGRFVTIIPHGRREDTWFRDFAQSHVPEWQEAYRRAGARLGDPDELWRTFVAPLPSAEGYRVIWVHSSTKAARDANGRQARVEAGLAAIEAVAARLSSPKSRLRTKVAAEEAAASALAQVGASRWVGFVVNEEQQETFSQERRGRPGSDTRYRKRSKSVFSIAAVTKADAIAYDAATDGCFPLVSNADEASPAEVLEFYRYQPNLERRNHMLKGPQAVAPVFIEHPHRIEAIMLCHFLAMLTEALIEREIRTSMKAQSLTGIPLYPELRNCPSPSTPRILEVFADAQRHNLMSKGKVVQVFDPELTPLHQQVLGLLHVPTSVYASTNE
ncbi:MAG: IS1634 family transposase, partial [Nitrososphaerales archaeon]